MYEVEVKVEAAHDPVRERLVEMGAETLGVVHQHDTYYDHPVRSFAETDEALRLRRESTPDGPSAPRDGDVGATLTYKGPLVDDVSKTRQEIETGLDDPVGANAILRAVAFEPVAEVEKERERFACGGYTVALDTVRDLGEFVEIEAEGDESDIERLREGALGLCRRLGLDPDAATRSSYLALLLPGDGALSADGPPDDAEDN